MPPAFGSMRFELAWFEAKPRPPQPQPELIRRSGYFRGLRYLGQLHRTYLVCEGARGLVLIDQHAAHERMNYQRLRRAAAERRGQLQPLLVPILLQLAPAAAARIAEGADDLAAIGVEVEPFGGGSAAVKALPAPLASSFTAAWTEFGASYRIVAVPSCDARLIRRQLRSGERGGATIPGRARRPARAGAL